MSGQDAIADAIKRASEIAMKATPYDITHSSAKRIAEETPAKLTLSQRLQEIGVYSFPFTDISQLDLRRGEELDEYKIPEDIITYIVGTKCEQIDRLKKETGCKIYIESEVREGNTDVLVALVGSRENLRKAKGSMDIVVAKGRIFSSAAKNSPFGADTGEAVEILIPGSMAGLIIGKNGETIKSMQSSTGARMIMIQDNSVPTLSDKPLRITGEVHQVQAALKLVNELMATREADTSIARKYTCECYKLPIANEKCGIAIGRGGETIREINEESGALVEISKMIPPNDYEKEFNIWGTRDEVISAVQMICSRTQTPLPQDVVASLDQENKYHPFGLGMYTPATTWTGMVSDENLIVDPNMAAYYSSMSQYRHQVTSSNPEEENQPNASSTTCTPEIDPVTGQPDYTNAWVEYFKSLGEHDKAQALLDQQNARLQKAELAKTENLSNNEDSSRNDQFLKS